MASLANIIKSSVRFKTLLFIKTIEILRFSSPLQRPGNIPGHFGPIDECSRSGIKAIIIGLGIIRPVTLGDPGLYRYTGSCGDIAGAAGKSDLEIMIGGAIGRTHRDNGTGNITSAGGRIVTIEILRLGAVFGIIVPHGDR